MWGKTQVSFGTFGIYEQTNITVFAMTVAGSSAIPWQPPEAALYLGVIELCTSRLLFQSHDTLPPIIVVAEPLAFIAPPAPPAPTLDYETSSQNKFIRKVPKLILLL